MKYAELALRNLWRNPRRTAFTMLSTALSMFVFSTLASFSGHADRVVARTASAVRIAVHNKAGLNYRMPDAYKRKIAMLPHVEAVAAQTWFGGIYHQLSDQFPNLAVDSDSIDKIWPDWGVSPSAVQEFKQIRIACLVGSVTMQRNHWRIGQRILLRGTEYPVDVTLTIVGTLGPNGMPDLLVFRRDYLEQVAGRAGQVSLIWVKVDSPHYVSQVIGAIDEIFANSDHETQSEAEAPFLGSFLTSCQMFVRFARLLCLFALAAMGLVSANTAAMSVRERRAEIAVMRAVGFTPKVVLAMLVGESAIVNTAGGLVGCAAAYVFCGAVALGASSAFACLSGVEITPQLIAGSVAASTLVSALSALLPAGVAMRRTIVDGLRARAGA